MPSIEDDAQTSASRAHPSCKLPSTLLAHRVPFAGQEAMKVAAKEAAEAAAAAKAPPFAGAWGALRLARPQGTRALKGPKIMNPVEPHRALGFLEGFYIGLLQNFDWPPAIPLTFIYSPQGFCKGCVEAADRVEGLGLRAC